MINSQLSLEAENRPRQEMEAIDLGASRQTELNSAGKFDGLIGMEPDREKWGELAYREGFLAGRGSHYDQKYQMRNENKEGF